MSKDNYQYVEDMSNRFIEDLKNIYSNETIIKSIICNEELF